MTNYAMKAVVLGPRSGGDRWYDYEFDRDPEQTPADELVESFMQHLHDEKELPAAYAYELNSAIKNPNKRVVMAIGSLHLQNEDMPFVSMISWG
ncbi:MAG: hypothetical protein MI920_14585 [Kiloniellales bacterium]|nr:hypothetical protein [Kiloniellales bacterium]